MPTTASTTLEIEIDLSGTYVRGYPERGPTYDCGGEPAEPDQIEDMDVDGVYALKVVRSREGKITWSRIDLLAGVDRQSAAYRHIINNLLAVVDAEEALIAEAA